VRPAFSVIFLTTLSGAGQGLFLALYFVDFFYGVNEESFVIAGAALAGLLAALGLFASFFHLGRLRPAWRSASQWRTSWLSREVILLPAFIAGCFAYAVAHYVESAWVAQIAFVTFALCLALFLCTGMIYACLKFLQEWASPLTLINFLLLGCASGFTLATLLAALIAPSWLRFYAHAAIALTLVAAVFRAASLARNARLRPKSTLQSAIGVRAAKIEQKSMGFMGGSFNTREFFHGRTPEALRAVKWGFLLLAFAAPALMLASQLDSGSAAVLGAAFAVQYAGLVAERWYFFAQANHPQNLYYQVIS
jgi:sulfite dehydrogenase (quinone) subunit SoeC